MAASAPAARATPAASTANARVEGARVALDGTLDFDTARDVLARTRPVIEAHAASTIDLAGVVRSNSAGLALIVEWLAVARRAGHAVSFANVPDGLRQLARVCEVDGLLADAAV